MKYLNTAVLTLILLISCKKNNADVPLIDVNNQTFVNEYGDNIFSNGSASSGLVFNESELSLFNSLDTVDLTGTSQPNDVLDVVQFPNPIDTSGIFTLKFQFNNTYLGYTILKYVIVDDRLHTLAKNTHRLQGNHPSSQVHVSLQEGKYRLYLTLSSLDNKNYFKKWINFMRKNRT